MAPWNPLDPQDWLGAPPPEPFSYHPYLWIKIRYQLADLSRSIGLVSHEIIHSFAKVYVTVGIKEVITRELLLVYQEIKPNSIPL